MLTCVLKTQVNESNMKKKFDKKSNMEFVYWKMCIIFNF